MSFLREFIPWRPEAPPGRQSVQEFMQSAGWTREEHAAARALGFPASFQVLEQRHGVMVGVDYVVTAAAVEWQRDACRLFTRAEPTGPLLVFSRPNVTNQIEVAAALRALGWSREQHETARLFGFPREHHAETPDPDGRRWAAVLRRHELDVWLSHVRQLVPGFAAQATR